MVTIKQLTTKARQNLLLVAAMLMTVALGGCSQDKHEFVSTPELPTTVSLVNALRPTEVIWSKEVPVGHKLVLDFDREGEVEWAKVENLPATHLSWKIEQTGGDKDEIEKGEMPLSGDPIQIRASYRKREGATK